MRGRLFDTVIIADWSSRGARSPQAKSADALWIGIAGTRIGERYFRTRAEAMRWLASLLATERAEGRRALAGFDFPFGYPAGFAAAVMGVPRALALWKHLADQINDDKLNHNNRFDVAATLNSKVPGTGPFWGNGLKRGLPHLPRNRRSYTSGLSERRIVERPPYARNVKLVGS